MGQIEGQGEAEHAIRIEELLRQPDMRQRDDVVRSKFAVQAPDPARHQRAFQLHGQVAQAGRQQGLVAGLLENDRPPHALTARACEAGRHSLVRGRTKNGAAASDMTGFSSSMG